MPIRKSYRSRPRVYRRRRKTASTYRRRTNNPQGVRFRNSNGIPDYIVSKYPYAQSISGSTSITVGQSLFQNSMYNPCYSGGAHQPFMRDQIAVLYNKYKCYGFSYSVTIQNTSSSDAIRWSIYPVNHIGAPASMDLACEKPYSKCGNLTPDTGSKAQVTITGYLSAARVLGVSKKTFNCDDKYDAAAGNNPAVPAYLAITYQASNGTTSITPRITVKLTYFTKYFNRATVGSS